MALVWLGLGYGAIVRRKEEMRQQSVGSALSSADPVQVTAKIVSLIDTIRYIKLATKAGPLYI